MSWINVNDRLPDTMGNSNISDNVFIETKQGIVMQAYYDYRYRQWFNIKGDIISNPLHWEEN